MTKRRSFSDKFKAKAEELPLFARGSLTLDARTKTISLGHPAEVSRALMDFSKLVEIFDQHWQSISDIRAWARLPR